MVKFDELLSKPLDELTDEEIMSIVDKLTPAQLSKLEKHVKRTVAAKVSAAKRPKSQKAKELEDLFNQAMCAGKDAR